MQESDGEYENVIFIIDKNLLENMGLDLLPKGPACYYFPS